MRSKHIIVMLVTVFFAMLLTGCGHNSRFAVIKHLEEKELGPCAVSWWHEDITESDDGHGPTTRVWKVRQKSTGIEFNVYDSPSEGMFSPIYNIHDDYYVNMAKFYKDEIPQFENISMDPESFQFYFTYENKEQLRQRCDEMAVIFEFFQSKYPKVGIFVKGQFLSPFIDQYKGTFLEDFITDNITGTVYDSADFATDGLYKNSLDFYCKFGMRYGLEDILDDLSSEEKEAYINNSGTERVVYIIEGSKDELKSSNKEIDPAITANYGVLSFAQLYDYLTKHGFQVSGNRHDFTVTNIQGQSCRFSYDFVDDDNRTTYYLLEGKEIALNRVDFGLYEQEIEEMFGLKTLFITNGTIEFKKENGQW